MAGPVTIPGDVTFREGAVNMAGATSFTAPAACIGDSNVTAASPLGVTKTRRRFSKGFSQVKGSAAASETGRVIHTGYGATGTVVAVRAGITVAAVGAATVTVDVKKNGSSIMTAVIQLDTGNTVLVAEAGSITTAAYVSGDTFETVIVATAGGGTLPQGLFVDVVFDEDPA